MASRLEVRDLVHTYAGNPLFRMHLPQLDIEAGEKVALVGPSGTGKTTLISLLSGILRPRSGSIRYGDFLLTGATDDQLRAFRISTIGFVFQEIFLLEYLTVWENILLPYALNPVLHLDQGTEKHAAAVATRIGIKEAFQRFPGELSQGERQRVAIGRALITRPPWLIADEPTANLDAATARTVMDLLFEEATAEGCTFLMVTHDPGLLSRFDRVLEVNRFLIQEEQA